MSPNRSGAELSNISRTQRKKPIDKPKSKLKNKEMKVYRLILNLFKAQRERGKGQKTRGDQERLGTNRPGESPGTRGYQGKWYPWQGIGEKRGGFLTDLGVIIVLVFSLTRPIVLAKTFAIE